jgi:hypothetical protein
MCIICVKKPGLNLPNSATIDRLWQRNPDGAGFMWAQKGGSAVHIRKGFMTLGEFKQALYSVKDSKSLAMVLHFRITTHGGTCAANTHPFPITANLDKLRDNNIVSSQTCFAHNGILPIKPKRADISDTMEFSRSRLAPVMDMCEDFINNEAAMALIEDMSEGSRLAFLSPTGQIRTTGGFYEDPKSRLLYSNTSFMQTYTWPEYDAPRRRWQAMQTIIPSAYGFHNWDDDDEMNMPWER